ncbi:MAG: glutamine amidotransferase [Bradymonadia bacterium]
MKPILLKTGRTFPELKARRGDYEDWFAAALGWSVDQLELIDVTDVEAPLPEPGVDALIITGSPASVHHREPWSERAGAWVKAVVEAGVPTLGVCYGHQIIGDVFGGEVGLNPNGREMGVVQMQRLVEDPIFEGLPSVFPVVETHTDAVNVAPPGATVLASTANTAVQAMAYGDHCRSVQWHPEFDADIIRHYIDARREMIDAEGGPGTADAMLATVVDVDTGPIIMANFVRHWLK